MRRMAASLAAFRASSAPLTVSWSLSASVFTPAAAAAATTSAGGSAPSEGVECDWRSKVGLGASATEVLDGRQARLRRVLVGDPAGLGVGVDRPADGLGPRPVDEDVG